VEDANITIGDERAGLRYFEPARVAIAGVSCEGMTIRADGHVLGRLHGFVIDPARQRVRYLVLRTSGLLGRTKLVRPDAVRVDMENRAIEVPEDGELQRPGDVRPRLDVLIPAHV
jgi:hypothetical protein